MCDCVIYVHKGDSFYLDDIFKIFRQYNPTKRTILIGDDENHKYAEKYNLEFYNLKKIPDRIHLNNYKHVGINPPEYEKFCYERWLYIRHVMKKLNLKNALYSDSDNTFFMDVDTLFKECQDPNLMCFLNNKICVPNVFYATHKVYQFLANYISLFFSKSEEEIKEYAQEKQNIKIVDGKQVFQISDMFILKDAAMELKKNKKFKIQEIKTTNSLEFNTNFKSIKDCYQLKNGQPYKNELPIYNIHFQGENKKFIPKFTNFIS
jgi:hypothetical protein